MRSASEVRGNREAYGAAAAAFALLAMVLAFASLVAVSQKKSGTTVSAGGGTPVTLSEFKIDPTMITVPSKGTLVVTNGGTVPHNLNVEGTNLKTPDLDPGQSATIKLSSLKDGVYTVFCAIPGHRGQGMEAMLHVGAAGASASAASAESGSTGKTDALIRKTNDQMDQVMADPTKAYVAQLTQGPNTQGVGNQNLVPKILAASTALRNAPRNKR